MAQDPLEPGIQREAGRVTIEAHGLYPDLENQDPNDFPRDPVFEILTTQDLRQWAPLASAQHLPFSFTDVSSNPEAFYRIEARDRGKEEDGKNVIRMPFFTNRGQIDEPFLTEIQSSGVPNVRWVKFAILLSEPQQVIFQDSRKFLFHYDFASARLEPFKGMTPEEFAAVSLDSNGDQQVVLGTVLTRAFGPQELGIELIGGTPYPREQVADWLEMVRRAISDADSHAIFYMPTPEQRPTTAEDEAFYAERGFPLGSIERWLNARTIYADGWAVGRLVWIPGHEIETAFLDGRLRTDDILLTDHVPAEIPLVNGVVSIEASTPNSHVAILAKSFGVPFIYLKEPGEQDAAKALTGQEVYLSAGGATLDKSLKLIALPEDLPDSIRERLDELKATEPLAITPKGALGEIARSTRGLTPDDIRHVGGKAANFGFLETHADEFTPEAIAFSFDLWSGFMANESGDGPLQTRIAERLTTHRTFPPNDLAALKTALTEIQDWIKEASFTADQETAIIEALASFDPQRKIRFRSSTNVEDSARFSGAGLYDSFSGCLADDTDGDDAGPSHCDGSRSNERGVFRAIKKVFASFYSTNAYLERLRFGVDEAEVGMALLVHHSFPNEIELANGVATMQQRTFGNFVSRTANLVTQDGAVSVANPDTVARPELVDVFFSNNNPIIQPKQPSSLVPIGAQVMDFPKDYETLARTFASVMTAWSENVNDAGQFTLDFEYKKVEPGELVIKQVREVPQAEERLVTPLLLGAPLHLRTLQSEFDDLMSHHRLKSRWTITGRDIELTKDELRDSVVDSVMIEYLEDGQVKLREGELAQFSGYAYRLNENRGEDTWPMGEVRWQLGADIPNDSVDANLGPVKTLDDFRWDLSAEYPADQLKLEGGQLRATCDGEQPWEQCDTDHVRLEVDYTGTVPPNPQDLKERVFESKDGTIRIVTRFYYPPAQILPPILKTFPLYAWKETVITGLTAEPIILRGFYSQTMAPGHHNFWEEFLFDPKLEALEPNAPEGSQPLTAQQRAELEAANVSMIYGFWGGITGGESRLRIISPDGKLSER